MIRQERTQIFATTAQKVGSALIDFAQTRSQLLLRNPDESFEQYERRISTENFDTQSLYSKLYAVQVARLRYGFARRGLKTSELDEFYQRPGSDIAILEVGKTLFDNGAALRSKGVPAEVKGWRRSILSIFRAKPRPKGQAAG